MPIDSSSRPTASDGSRDTPSTANAQTVDPAFEERWAAWRARGHQHELAVQRRVRVMAVAVAILVVLVVVAFRLLGDAL